MRNRIFAVLAFFLFVFEIPLAARILPVVRDEDLQNAEVILVGRADRASVGKGGRNLTIKVNVSEVIRGEAKAGETISVRVGTLTMVDKYYKDGGTMLNLRGFGRTPPAEGAQKPAASTINIVDFGSSCFPPAQSPDVSRDTLWFLWKKKGGQTLSLSLSRAEHIQDLRYKPYFLALLSEDPHGGFLKLLHSRDSLVTHRALNRLIVFFRADDAFPASKCLDDPDPKVAEAAARLMGSVGDNTAIPLMRKVLDHANPKIRRQACEFLCRFDDLDSLPAMAKAMKGMDNTSLRCCWI